jgi:hypothetical protein
LSTNGGVVYLPCEELPSGDQVLGAALSQQSLQSEAKTAGATVSFSSFTLSGKNKKFQSFIFY